MIAGRREGCPEHSRRKTPNVRDFSDDIKSKNWAKQTEWRKPFHIQDISWKSLGENEKPSEDCNWFWPIECIWIILDDEVREAQIE